MKQTGLKCISKSGFSYMFFKIGLIMLFFNSLGKIPNSNEELIILVIVGTIDEATSFKILHGIGSSSHCLFVRFFIIDIMSSDPTSLNLVKELFVCLVN